MLYTTHTEFYAEASKLFIHAMFQLVTCKMASLDSILQGAKTMEMEGAKSESSASNEDLIHLPVWPNPSNSF
jgi:hypothetical protein